MLPYKTPFGVEMGKAHLPQETPNKPYLRDFGRVLGRGGVAVSSDMFVSLLGLCQVLMQ